jgi:O-antigen/teichoic acid export membrane protein
MNPVRMPSRFKKMLIAVFLGRGLMALRQLILVPVLISAWGVEYYGSWLMLSALPTFLSMSNLGLGTSANIQIGLDINAGRHSQAKQAFATSQWMIIFIGLFVTVLSYIGMHWYGLKTTSPVIIESPDVVVFLLLTALFVNMLAIPLLGCWTGIGKLATGYKFLNYNSLASLILSIVVPLAGGKALETAIILLISSLCYFVLFVFFTFQSIEWTKNQYSLKLIDLNLGKYLFFKGIGHQLGQLWQAILFQGSLLLAGYMIGPAGAALWGSMRILIRSGNQVVEVISQSISPEFQIAFAQENKEKLRSTYVFGIMLSFSLALLIVVGLIIIGPTIFNIWTKNSFVVPNFSWWILSFSLLPFALWNLSGELQRAVNQPWLLNVWAVIASLISVSCMAVFAKMGILAFSIGAFVFDVCMMFFVIPKTLHLLEISLPKLFLSFVDTFKLLRKNSKFSFKSKFSKKL